jgi:hypothetical protein
VSGEDYDCLKLTEDEKTIDELKAKLFRLCRATDPHGGYVCSLPAGDIHGPDHIAFDFQNMREFKRWPVEPKP